MTVYLHLTAGAHDLVRFAVTGRHVSAEKVDCEFLSALRLRILRSPSDAEVRRRFAGCCLEPAQSRHVRGHHQKGLRCQAGADIPSFEPSSSSVRSCLGARRGVTCDRLINRLKLCMLDH